MAHWRPLAAGRFIALLVLAAIGLCGVIATKSRILSFTLGLTFITGIVFGLLPALRASRADPWTTLKVV